MPGQTRRGFLKHAGLGVAAFGVSTDTLILAADRTPTPSDENPAAAEQVLLKLGPPPEAIKMPDDTKLTSPNPLGPFYRRGAPFRGKATPPFEPGQVMVVSGRVWAFDTKRPLGGAILDVWQVDIQGKYSAGDGDFKNRTRLLTSESGYYEFETIHPVAYQPSDFWRSAHIHYRIVREGYLTLITELFFEGDPKQEVDPMFKKALVRPIKKEAVNGQSIETVGFDIVLEAEN